MRRLVQITVHPRTTTRLCHSSEESPAKTPGCSENSLLDFRFPFKNTGWNGTTLKIYLNRSLLQCGIKAVAISEHTTTDAQHILA
jgi:hypothetical protein